MATHRVTLIPRDGTGPQLTEATPRVDEAAAATFGSSFDWDVQEAGVDIVESAGTPLPKATLASIRETKVEIKGPIIPRSAPASARSTSPCATQLYAGERPCKSYPGVRTRFPETDVVIIRENTEDLYAGIGYEQDTKDANSVINFLNKRQDKQIREHSGIFAVGTAEYPDAIAARLAG